MLSKYSISHTCQPWIETPHSAARKGGFTRTLKHLRSAEAGLWARIFGSPLGGNFKFLRERSDDELLSVTQLLTRYFIPIVASFVSLTKRKVPVYMVTGIVIAVGAKLSKVHSKKTNASGELSGTYPNSGITGGVNAGMGKEDSASAAFDGSKDYVLGLRVRKIWWNKEGLRQTSDKVAGATLNANKKAEKPSMLEGAEFVDDFTVSQDKSPHDVKIYSIEENENGIEASNWVFPSHQEIDGAGI
ncbi:hypothetical protein P280DRAFT_491890 [Massarina eburnea CBS 473.64]|uniref:Uncharacterized protein n=1 Tax=Massarina eburnea CBS 473.64 TaxID=1395130 RepID=A0A6A6RRE9_9PLEO|nr:hypothetical protein P280DRAFT_491890 [Massarina eburnea CBS 473.64]